MVFPLFSESCFQSDWPAGRRGAMIEPLIPNQPTMQPCGSWSAEQVHEALRPARTSRKFSIRDQSVLLTWHRLQPVRFHHWLHKCTCSPDGWPGPSWFVLFCYDNWTHLNLSIILFLSLKHTYETHSPFFLCSSCTCTHVSLWASCIKCKCICQTAGRDRDHPARIEAL